MNAQTPGEAAIAAFLAGVEVLEYSEVREAFRIGCGLNWPIGEEDRKGLESVMKLFAAHTAKQIAAITSGLKDPATVYVNMLRGEIARPAGMMEVSAHLEAIAAKDVVVENHRESYERIQRRYSETLALWGKAGKDLSEALARAERAEATVKDYEPLIGKAAEAMGFIRFTAHPLGIAGESWSEEPGFSTALTSAFLRFCAAKKEAEQELEALREQQNK